ncbi:MAG: hypothetical protein R2716_00870 [Microthrixaceae bacterium]
MVKVLGVGALVVIPQTLPPGAMSEELKLRPAPRWSSSVPTCCSWVWTT